jgi:ABC-type Zn uptake system ZnuABC Zn-binding protein ZnuA
MAMKYLMPFIVFSILLSQSLYSAEQKKTISCTHIQVCNALSFVLGPDNSYVVKNLIDIGPEDPHHFEPTVGDIKKIQKAESLVLPPLSLQPWLKNVVTKIKKDPKKNITIIVAKNEHFWLQYTSLCSVLKQLSQSIKKSIKSDINGWKCDNTKSGILKTKLKDKTFILLHDSLGNYFKELNLNYHALRGHGHLDTISAKSLKQVHHLVKSKAAIVWILEKQIHTPHALERYFKQDHVKLYIDTLGRLGTSPFEVINQLNKELGKL